jgi:hypothetical protein
LIYGRTATSDEIAAALAFLEQAESATSKDFGRWEQLAQVLLLSNEFVFVD